MTDKTDNEDKLNAIIQCISQARIETYLKCVGHKKGKALELYIWNAKICESFYLPIQAVEITIKNLINETLIKLYGDNWWDSRKFIQICDREKDKNLKAVFERLINRNQIVSNDNVVSDLTFGFWASLLDSSLNPHIWGKEFENTFKHSKGKFDRKMLGANIKRIVKIRNRIFHHEPLINEDISAHYRTIFQTLYWLNPIKAEWIKSNCNTMKLMRQKPK